MPDTRTMSVHSRVRHAPDVIAGDIQGEMVMMDMAGGRYIGLDGIGTDIWRRIEAERTIGALVADLARDYAAEPDRIEHDLIAYFGQLAALGLVVIQDAR